MDMDLDIMIDPDLLQIRLKSTHQYSNPIQIHFKPTQIRFDWIWITWILDQIQSIAIPKRNFTFLPDIKMLKWAFNLINLIN